MQSCYPHLSPGAVKLPSILHRVVSTRGTMQLHARWAPQRGRRSACDPWAIADACRPIMPHTTQCCSPCGGGQARGQGERCMGALGVGRPPQGILTSVCSPTCFYCRYADNWASVRAPVAPRIGGGAAGRARAHWARTCVRELAVARVRGAHFCTHHVHPKSRLIQQVQLKRGTLQVVASGKGGSAKGALAANLPEAATRPVGRAHSHGCLLWACITCALPPRVNVPLPSSCLPPPRRPPRRPLALHRRRPGRVG